MTTGLLPRYPVYVLSKGRWGKSDALTARFLIRDRVPFHLVVEPQEAESYAAEFGEDRLLVTPFSELGQGSIPARNYAWEHSREHGHERHWEFDDNIRRVDRMYQGKRIPCAAGPALAAIEDFVDRYENVAIGGMNYHMFGTKGMPPFIANVHVYSSLLILNDLPYRWRGRYNEDTDLCLQVLSAGWCTVLTNVFLIYKIPTMKMKGGNTDDLYQGDGRLKMARSLERNWPHVVRTDRRWQRPQHVVRDNWRKFDTPLRLKPGLSLDQFAANEYGLGLKQVKAVRNEQLRQWAAEHSPER